MGDHQDLKMDALLVGYENQENLGLRSITAYLRARGFRVELVPFFPDRHDVVLEAVQKSRPRLVGFSLIFQYALDEFSQLINTLRAQGVAAHFTAGGHFPSLRPEETLRLLPGLDSIVRFEGELTLAELLQHLDHPDRWEQIPGLVFRRGSEILLTPKRPLIADLDSLPPIYRDDLPRTASGVNMAFMLASRGCLHHCSFCSIRQFYGGSSGPLRRVRSPGSVVDEMRLLFSEKDVRFFSFQDDDFAARTPQQRKWLAEFLEALARAGLSDHVRWKVSCRVDDLNEGILKDMIDHGLMAVYLGVESGSDAGLRTLGKRTTAAQNLAAIELLKEHNVAMAIGFMLFDPSSSFETIQENLNFLGEAGKDGYFVINFCKMLPYAGTPIEAELRGAGRLRGTLTKPDYALSDSELDWYEFAVTQIFNRRNFGRDGIVARLQEADFSRRLERAFHGIPEDGYETRLRELTKRSNLLAVETLERLLHEVRATGMEVLIKQEKILLEISEREWRGEAMVEVELDALRQREPERPGVINP